MTRALKRWRRHILILTITLFGVMATVTTALWPYFSIWYKRLVARPIEACNCSQLAFLPDQPFWLFLLMTILVIFVGLVGRGLYRVITMLYRTAAFERLLQQQVKSKTIASSIPIYRVNHRQPLAVCLGYFRPRIYLSTALEELLQSTELLSVIRHELHHARQHDPLQRLVFTGLAALFPWHSRTTFKNFTTLQELVADEAVADDRQLSSALLKTLNPTLEQPAMAAVWFSATDARLNRLLGRSLELPQLWPLSLLAGGLIIVTLVLYQVFITQTGPAAAAFGQCLAEQPMCELLMSYVVQ